MRRLLLALGLAAALIGCGGEEATDNAVEATEANTVELGGVRYRVAIFRELNPREEPDEEIYEGPVPAEGHGIYAAFLTACNPSGATVDSTAEVVLEDAFGQRFEPLPARTDDDFGYTPAPLAEGECMPSEGSVAARVGDGAAVVFEVPFDAVDQRPLILELAADGGQRRIQLDV